LAPSVDVSVAVIVVDGGVAVDVTIGVEVLPLIPSPEVEETADEIEVDSDVPRAEAWIAWITANGTVMSPLAGIWPSPLLQQVWLSFPVERGQTVPSWQFVSWAWPLVIPT